MLAMIAFPAKGGLAMPDDLHNRGPQDASRINVNEEWELKYWCRELGVTPEELRAAVSQVGVMASAVRKHLGK
jgi:hypothetical protein